VPKLDRLDRVLVERGLAESRTQAQALVMAGEVRINGEVARKVGQRVDPDAEIEVQQKPPYVSRGGLKLEGALTDFDYDPTGKTCADVGASTGGFTDLLLQKGAAKVYAIDVGYGQLAWKLRQDARVVVVERTNARHLETLGEPIDLAVMDASFIST
jgi:23S rRNA (cytidine1920-2'-O)/16S rRNA (cytidine1409-2'-O)-methyltransferase